MIIRSRMKSALLRLLLLTALLPGSGLLSAEFQAAALGSAVFVPDSEADLGARAVLDLSLSKILDPLWAVSTAASLDARLGSLSGPSAISGVQGDISLAPGDWTFILGASSELRIDAAGFALPSARLDLSASLRIGEGQAWLAFHGARSEEVDAASGQASAPLKLGGELGGEAALGILILSPSLEAAVSIPDIGGSSLYLGPQLGLSLYPSIPAWGELRGGWERDMDSAEDSITASLQMAWIPLPSLELGFTGEGDFDAGSSLLSASLWAALDLGRWGNKSLCLPVNLYVDTTGAFGAEAGMRFTID